MKNAQIAGQIFIFIMAAIIIGVIILLGYNAISTTLLKGCQAEEITFKSKMETLISKSSGYGSVAKEPIIAPCSYEYVCFIDATQIGDASGLSGCNNKILSQSAKDGDMKNIFVSTTSKTIPIGYSALLRLENPENCTCIKQKSKTFKITFKGLGSGTELSETLPETNTNPVGSTSS
ncbi:MAG: hypothetical protein ACP5NV_02700 [Candidatus Woesearchaeota archaeon]